MAVQQKRHMAPSSVEAGKRLRELAMSLEVRISADGQEDKAASGDSGALAPPGGARRIELALVGAVRQHRNAAIEPVRARELNIGKPFGIEDEPVDLAQDRRQLLVV